jgi:hypothetical protein
VLYSIQLYSLTHGKTLLLDASSLLTAHSQVHLQVTVHAAHLVLSTLLREDSVNSRLRVPPRRVTGTLLSDAACGLAGALLLPLPVLAFRKPRLLSFFRMLVLLLPPRSEPVALLRLLPVPAVLLLSSSLACLL